ncbi:MAG TPA: pitrilysin family protein [Candidatus Saccharimonadales bacterium]|nr:pitrilysin family protein [Candidatus Saccharimonadales bacterium]
MHFKKTTFKNGLRLITAPMKDTNTVTVVVAVAAGSKYESKKINGLSHFLEHMFFKGTKKRPKTKDIAESLDAVGGEFNAYTSTESTAYYAKVDKEHIGLAIDVVSDIFLNSKIDPKEIEKERGVILQEINMYEDNPMLSVQEEFENLLYGDQPAGWKVIGTKENIARVSQKDFAGYMKNFYTAKNTVVSVVGNFGEMGESGVIKEIEKIFSKMRKGEVNKKQKTTEKQARPELKIKHKKTDQAHLVLGFRGYNMFHKDRFALALLANILGGTMSSRLFLSVRERLGLAYYVSAGDDESSDCGYFSVRAGVDTDKAKIEKTVKTIISEIKKMKARGVSEKELQKAKDNLRGKMALSLESSDEVAAFLAGQELGRREIKKPDEILRRIDKVKRDDILRVARDIFRNENLNLAIIGPIEDKGFLERILKL